MGRVPASPVCYNVNIMIAKLIAGTYRQETTETTSALTTSEAEAGVTVSYEGCGQQSSTKMEVVNGCHQILPKKGTFLQRMMLRSLM